MQKYRKKPVVIEAEIITKENALSLVSMIGGQAIEIEQTWNNGIVIPTLEGFHHGRYGDYLIRGIAGEYYPCKPEIFAQTYEIV